MIVNLTKFVKDNSLFLGMETWPIILYANLYRLLKQLDADKDSAALIVTELDGVREQI